MLKSSFIFGSFDSSESSGKYYKLEPINFPTPEKDVEIFEVPGRSGNLLVDYGSYKNVELSFAVSIESKNDGDTFLTLYDELRSAIMVQGGYQRLEDSLYPDEYRMAQAVSVEVGKNDTKNGTAVITLDAKPQRFLDSGDTPGILTPTSQMSSQYVLGIGKYILNSTALNLMYAAGVQNYEDREYMAVNLSNYATPTDSVKLYYPANFSSTLKPPAGSGAVSNCIAFMVCNTGSPLINETAGQMVTSTAYLTNDKTYEKKVGYGGAIAWAVFPLPMQFEIYHGGAVVESLLADSRELIPPADVVRYSPLIHVYVDGAISDANVLTIGESIIGLDTPATVGDSVPLDDFYIDCDTMNAYAVINNITYNLNKYVTMTGDFTFSGTVSVKTNSTIVSAEIYPRWWKI